MLIDHVWAAHLFCGFSEQKQSSCEALGTAGFFKREAGAIFGDIGTCSGTALSVLLSDTYGVILGTAPMSRLPLRV